MHCLMLTGPEACALGRAQAARVPLNEYEFPTAKVANVQSQLERLVEKNYYLHQSAREAYRGYLLAYNSHQLKDAFNVHTLDLLAVARSFGFAQPPRVRSSALWSGSVLRSSGSRRRYWCTWEWVQRISTCNLNDMQPQVWVMNYTIGQNLTLMTMLSVLSTI